MSLDEGDHEVHFRNSDTESPCPKSSNPEAPVTVEDPSIESPTESKSPQLTPSVRQAASNRHNTASSAGSGKSPYRSPIPQTAFTATLRAREKKLQQIISSRQTSAQRASPTKTTPTVVPSHQLADDILPPLGLLDAEDTDDGKWVPQSMAQYQQQQQQHNNTPQHESVSFDACHDNGPHTASTVHLSVPSTGLVLNPQTRESSATNRRRIDKTLRSFPTTSVKDPFCPKPPIHGSAIRLEASVQTIKTLFFPGLSGRPSTSERLTAGHSAHDLPHRPQTAPATEEQNLPQLVVSEPTASTAGVTTTTAGSPPSNRILSAGSAASSYRLHRPLDESPLSNNDGDVSPANGDSIRELMKLVHYLPTGYREPEVALQSSELVHPRDPVTGKLRPRRRYRLGLQHDPANILDPIAAAHALTERGLPTQLSVASTDPSVLAVVDAIIESTPGLEQVDLGSMDDRYEMVLRNVYTAISRNVSVGKVTGELPKAATKAIDETIHANTERRQRRLNQLTAKERELKIAAMEQRILKERQEQKKINFEHMRQRARLCERHMRGYRDICRDEADAWLALDSVHDASWDDVRSKERARFQWWESSVQALESEMYHLRITDSRVEHDIREAMRLNEVNQRLALQIELRRELKQRENERHVVFAAQFQERKSIRFAEKTARRTIEMFLTEKLKAFLEARSAEERRLRDEEIQRQFEEVRLAERRKRLERDQESLAANEVEKRKAMEIEAWKAYDMFKRKHFEGIVVAKNLQRTREQRERRLAAFQAADAAVPTLSFRMTPQTTSGAGISSASPTSSNTLGYQANTLGDLLVMNQSASLRIGFETDISALTWRQKVTKAEHHGGVISCRIQRDDLGAVLSGLEGVALYIPTDPRQDFNVAVNGFVERKAGETLPTSSFGFGSNSPPSDDVTPHLSSLSPPLALGSRRKSNSATHSRSRGPAFSHSQTKTADDIECEQRLKYLCGEDRIFGVLTIREDFGTGRTASSGALASKSSGAALSKNSEGSASPSAQQPNALDNLFGADVLLMDEIESGSDSADSSNSLSSGEGDANRTRSANTSKRDPSKQSSSRKSRKGCGSMIKTEPAGPPKRPRRRIISWNGEDVGVIELGYGGAPIEISKMTTYYYNTAVAKLRARRSVMMRHVDSRRGTVDVTENVSPLDSSIQGPAAHSTTMLMRSTMIRPDESSSVAQTRRDSVAPPLQINTSALGGGLGNRSGSILRSRGSVYIAPSSPAFASNSHDGSVGGSSGGVEVLRIHLYPRASRHAISDILAHLAYFNASGVQDISNAEVDCIVPNELTRVSTQLILGFAKSCLPTLSSGGETGVDDPLTPNARGTSSLSSVAFLTAESGAVDRKSSTMSTESTVSTFTSNVRMPAAACSWSTRTTNTYIRVNLPLFMAESQREPIYFLEDQKPLPLCPLDRFAWCLPVTNSVLSESIVPTFALDLGASFSSPMHQAVQRVFGAKPLLVNGQGDTPSSNSISSPPLNYVQNNTHVVIRDLRGETLDAMDVLVGRTAVHGFHIYLSILDRDAGDVFVLLEEHGVRLGSERVVTITPTEDQVNSRLPPGRRLVATLDDCSKDEVGVEQKRVVRELRRNGDVFAYVEGFLLPERSFAAFSDRFDAAMQLAERQQALAKAAGVCATKSELSNWAPRLSTFLEESMPSVGEESLSLRSTTTTVSAGSSALTDAYLSPIRITMLSNLSATLSSMRDLMASIAYANLNKDPSAVIRHVDVAMTDRQRQQCAVVRHHITVVPVDDITEIDVKQPPCGFRVYRAPAEVKAEYVPMLPPESPFFVAPDTTAEDPDSMNFEGGWMEVEIIDGLRDGDVLYILSDERLFIEDAHHWSLENVTQSNYLFRERQASISNSNRVSRDATPMCRSPTGESATAGGDPSAATTGGRLADVSNGRGRSSSTVSGDSQSSFAPQPKLWMGTFSDDEDEAQSEMVVVAGLALDEIPPFVNRREMHRGRLSGMASPSPGTCPPTPETGGLVPAVAPSSEALDLMAASNLLGTSLQDDELSMRGAQRGSCHYASALIRIEFKEFSLAGLQYLLRRIAFKNVAASEKNPKYFGPRTIQFRLVVGDPTVPKFRKYDPFVPITCNMNVRVCEPLLKNIQSTMTYKEGQGTMGIPMGLVEPGTDGYRWFNRGYFSATIIKGATADDRIVMRAVDPTQFEYGLSMLDVDPAAVFQPKRSVSFHSMKRMNAANRPASGGSAVSGYTPMSGGIGPDGEVNPNCRPPPPSLHSQWVKAIATGKYKFQQWKCCELYNSDRAMVGFLTSTYSEIFIGLRESDKNRKFGKAALLAGGGAAAAGGPPGSGGGALGMSFTQSLPSGLTFSTPNKNAVSGGSGGGASNSAAAAAKKKGQKERSAAIVQLAEKEAKAIAVPLPEGSTPIRHNDVLSITKILAFENRSSNPTDLKKAILISLSDEWSTSHIVVEVNVQPVDDATEFRRSHTGPLGYRHGFDKSFIPLFEHCTLYDPDTNIFNGGHFQVSIAQPPLDGDCLRLLSLDEQRQHRESLLKDPHAKFRGKPKDATAGSSRTDQAKSSPPAAGRRTQSNVKSAVSVTGGSEVTIQVPSEDSSATKDVSAKPTEEPKEDPNEPYDFYFSERDGIIYWVDTSAAKKQMGGSAAQHRRRPDGASFVESGAFDATNVAAPVREVSNSMSGGRMLRGEDAVLRRIGTYQMAADRRQFRSGLPVLGSVANPSQRVRASDAHSGGGGVPDDLEQSKMVGTVLDQSRAALDQSFASRPSHVVATNSAGHHRSSSLHQNVVNLSIKLDPLVPDEDMDDEVTDVPAAVTLKMLQALTRCVVFYSTSMPQKVKFGPRSFVGRVGSSAGGEDGKVKVIVQVAGSLLGWTEGVIPNVMFRPRMGVIFPLQRLLFLNDTIIKSGFLLVEISEGFEPLEDVVKLTELGRAFTLRGGKLFLNPKDQLIGQFHSQEVDGVPYGYLIAIDASCRVSGSILQTLVRSFAYTNSTKRTGRRKLRVTMCDGTYYETSVAEVDVTVEQDEDTVPIRFGASAGKVVFMDSHPASHVFPDLSLTLKGPNLNRILIPPAVLDVETTPGAVLQLDVVNHSLFTVTDEGQLMVGGVEAGQVTQAASSNNTVYNPHPPGFSLARSGSRMGSFHRRAREGGSIGGAPAAGGKTPTSPQLASPPHVLRVEFSSFKMDHLEALLRCVTFSKFSERSYDDDGNGSAHSTPRTSSIRFVKPVQPMALAVGRRPTVSFGGHSNVTKSPINNEGTIGSTFTESAAVATLSSPTLSHSSGSSQFVVNAQLNGTTNEAGKVSYLPILHAQAVVRCCEAPELFSFPSSRLIQGPAGDIFSGVQVSFVPRFINFSWKKPTTFSNDEATAVTGVDTIHFDTAAATPLVELLVTTRLGLAVSANGDDVFFGKEKIASIVANPSGNSTSDVHGAAADETNPLAAVKATWSSDSGGVSCNAPKRRSLKHLESMTSAQAEIAMLMDDDDDEEKEDQLSPEDRHDSHSGFGLPMLTSGEFEPLVRRTATAAFTPKTPAVAAPPQASMTLMIHPNRRVTTEVIARLLRSMSTFPPLLNELEVTVRFEASQECSSTSILTIAPYAGSARRASRTSISGSSHTRAGGVGGNRKRSSATGGAVNRTASSHVRSKSGSRFK